MSSTDRRDNPDAQGSGETLTDLLNKRDRNLELRLSVSAPATVVSYNAATQRVSVILGYLPVEDNETATDVPNQPLKIDNVRVGWPQSGGGTTYDTSPLVAGDTGKMTFMDRALDEWMKKATPVTPALDPVDARAHSLADGIFTPDLAPNSKNISPATDLTARVLEAPFVKIGRLAVTGPDNLAKALALHTYLVAAVTAAPVVPMDGGAAFKAGLLAYLAANPYTNFQTTKLLAL